MIRENGFTLLEIMIVVAILGIVAGVAMPDLSSTDSKKLDMAAQVIAEAIVFARTDAIRKKIPHGINTDIVNDRIRVYSLATHTAVFDVYHPIDKKKYDIQLKTDAQLAGVDIVSAYFSCNGVFNSSSYLDFNTDGMPKLTGGFPQRDYLLTSAAITIAFKGDQRVISISPITGRVSVQ